MEFTEILLQLVEMVGVPTFILIITSLAIAASMPTIITKVFALFTSGKKEKSNREDIGFIKATLENYEKDISSISDTVSKTSNVVQNNTKYLSELKTDLSIFNAKRREENMLIVDTMEDMLNTITSIKDVMRNVMSEEDAIRLVSYLLGIISGFSTSLLKTVLDSIESFDHVSDEDLNERTLKSEMDNCWSTLKTEIIRFNTPIELKPILDKYDGEFWKTGGMFANILRISKEKKGIKTIAASVRRSIEIGLREMFDNISKSIQNR